VDIGRRVFKHGERSRRPNPREQPPFHQADRNRPIHARITRSSGVVSADPYVAFWDNDVFGGRGDLAGRVDVDDVAWEADEALADDAAGCDGGLEGDEVPAGEGGGEEAVGEAVFDDDFAAVG